MAVNVSIQIRRAEAAMLGAALLLFVSLFLPWFGASIGGGLLSAFDGGQTSGTSAHESAFTGSVPLAVILLLAALVIAVSAGVRLTGRELPGFQRPLINIAVAVAVVLVITGYLCMNPPGFGGSGGMEAALLGVTPTVDVGPWLAVIASLAALAGAGLTPGGLLYPGGDEQPTGRLVAAAKLAKGTAPLALWTLAAGALSLVVMGVGVLNRSAVVIIIALPVAIAACILGWFAGKQAAEHEQNGELRYLARFGQVSAWVVLVVVATILIIAIVALGHASSELNGVTNSYTNSFGGGG